MKKDGKLKETAENPRKNAEKMDDFFCCLLYSNFYRPIETSAIVDTCVVFCRPGEEVQNLKGGVAGGSILKGVLKAVLTKSMLLFTFYYFFGR